MPRAAVAWALLLLLAPAAAAQTYADASGDGDVLDIARVSVIRGNGTVTLEVRFVPGELPDDRAVRGVVLIGTPGQDEPAEWYHVTIANETTAYAGHGDSPRDAELVSTLWTGDLARAELRRDGAAEAPCVFAVVEAGTMTSTGFVRHDVAPSGFDSPDTAWPVDVCPTPQAVMPVADTEDEKGSPAAPLALLIAALVLLALRRR